MKNLANIAIAAAVSTNALLANAATASVPAVKLTEIKEENAEGAFKKLVKSGFLTPSKDGKKIPRATRSLKTRRNAPPPPPPKRAGTTRHYQTDDWHDDYFEYANDAYYYQDEDPYYYPDDYYYYYNYHYGKGAKSSKKSKKGKGKGGKGGKKGYYYYYDDDNYVMTDGDIDIGDDGVPLDDAIFGVLPYEIEGFLDVRNIDTPVFANAASPEFFSAGNVNVYVDTPLWEIDGVEATALIGLVQGTCTRTDPAAETDPEFVGSGFCSLTFEALMGAEVVASFSAEGRVLNANNPEGIPSVLTVKGGLGEFAGVTGEITLIPAFLDDSTFPAIPTADPELDFLSVSDGYIMEGFLFSDVMIDLFEDDDVPSGTEFPSDIFGDILDDLFGDLFGDATIDPSSTEDPTTEEPTIGEVVLCPGQDAANFCDCQGDCTSFPDTFCACDEAQACCGADAQ